MVMFMGEIYVLKNSGIMWGRGMGVSIYMTIQNLYHAQWLFFLEKIK